MSCLATEREQTIARARAADCPAAAAAERRSPLTPLAAPRSQKNQQYDSAKYWDQRYGRDPGEFEWYAEYRMMKTVVDDAIAGNRAAKTLQIGVGTSALAADVVSCGGHTGQIINVDVSRVCVEHMRGLHAHLRDRGVTYEVGDACDMRPAAAHGAAAAGAADDDPFRRFVAEDGSFDAVLDKGTLDALLCGCGAAEKGKALVSEAARVLRPGGAFLLVTYGAPDRRLGHLLPDAYTQSGSDSDDEEEEEEGAEGAAAEEAGAEEPKKAEEDAAEASKPMGPYGGRMLPWGPQDVGVYVIVKQHRREEAEAAIGRPPLPPPPRPAPTATATTKEAATSSDDGDEQGGRAGGGKEDEGGDEGSKEAEAEEEEEEQEDDRPPFAVTFGPLSPKDAPLMERVSALASAHFCYVCRRPADR